MILTPTPRLGGGVLNGEGFAAAPLPLALPGEPLFFARLPAVRLRTLELPGESEGKPHRGAALRKINTPSWEGAGGGSVSTL